MITAKSKTLSEYINTEYLFELVINRFGIDQNDLNKKLEEVKESGNADLSFLMEILVAFEDINEFSAERLQSFPLAVILNYLKKTHQYYLTKRLFEIEQSIDALTFRHRQTNPLLELLGKLFETYKRELREHIEMEELELFPYISFLEYAQEAKRGMEEFYQVHGHYSIEQFDTHHDDEVEKLLIEIRDKIIQYEPSIETTLAFKVFNTQLELFLKDLQIHALVEDEVLIPKARKLEKKILKHFH